MHTKSLFQLGITTEAHSALLDRSPPSFFKNLVFHTLFVPPSSFGNFVSPFFTDPFFKMQKSYYLLLKLLLFGCQYGHTVNKVQWKTNTFSYLIVIFWEVWSYHQSFEFFSDNLNASNKNRFSKCSGFKWLCTIFKKEWLLSAHGPLKVGAIKVCKSLQTFWYSR